MFMRNLFPVSLTVPRSQNSRDEQKCQTDQHKRRRGGKELSILEPQVPNETKDEAKYGQDNDPKVATSLILRSLLRGLLINLSDQAVNYAVVSDVVILQGVGIIA